MAWLLLNELSKIFGRLFMDNVDEENMLELSPKFFTFDANITLLFLKADLDIDGLSCCFLMRAFNEFC